MKLRQFAVLGAVGMVVVAGYSSADEALKCQSEAECQSKKSEIQAQKAALQAQIDKLNQELAEVVASAAFVKQMKRAGLNKYLDLNESKLGDVVKNGSKDVIQMTQFEAFDYCLNQNPQSERAAIREMLKKGKTPAKGIYLPTIRELAKDYKRFGVKTLDPKPALKNVSVDTDAVQTEIDQMKRDDYYAIYTQNSAGQKVVDFYLNREKYQRPAGESGDYWFWSSSVHPDDSIFAYDLNGVSGDVDYFRRRSHYYVSAVRCVRVR